MNDIILNDGFSVSFFAGVLSGLGVALILLFLKVLASFIYRICKNLNILNVWLNSKILFIYKNQKHAEKQMIKDAEKSEIIYVFSAFEPYVTERTSDFSKMLAKKEGDIRILFNKPNSQYNKDRENELGYAWSDAFLEGNIQELERIKNTNNMIQSALHDEYQYSKYFIFDKVMYIGFRIKGKNSTEAQIFRVGVDSILYKSKILQFNYLWEKYNT